MISKVYNNYRVLILVICMKAQNMSFLLTDIKRLMRLEFLKSDLTMTPMQARALVCVSRGEGIRQVALAEMLEIQPITLARLIDQLAADGLVERRADPQDRRAYGLYLTEEAGPCLKEIDTEIERVREKACQGLTEAQIKAAVDALTIMHTNLSTDSSI